jgi:integrase
MSRHIKLTQTIVNSARPKEVVEPLSDAAFALVLGKLDDYADDEVLTALHRGRDRQSAERSVDARMGKVMTAISKELGGAQVVIRNNKPHTVRHVHTMLCDSNGLYLDISIGKDGSIRKSWLWRFNPGQKVISKNGAGKERPRQRWMGLGSADVSKGGLTLADARNKVVALRKAKLIDGVDPLEVKHGARVEAAVAKAKAMTFGDCAAAYVATHSLGWRSAKHAKQWLTSLEQHCVDLMPLPIQVIDEAILVTCLRRLWSDGKIVTGQRVRGRIERTLDWARVNKLRPDNEANIARWKGHLSVILTAAPKPKHMKPCPWRELPQFMASLNNKIADDGDVAAMALAWVILTWVRTGTVRQAEWNEIDETDRIWKIPASHMKRNNVLRIPLPDDAMSLLSRLDRGSKRIFPIGPEAMRRVCKKIRDDVDVHGFRGSGKDWAIWSGYNRDLIDEQLGHVDDPVSLAYRQTEDWLEQRRGMMTAYSAFCSGRESGDNVVQMAGRRGG